MALRIAPIPQAELPDHLDQLAQLRIAVFRAFPYLYDGDLGYERDYLRPYAESPGAIVVAAWDGETMVGAATGSPLEDHAAEFGKPFEAAGYALDDVFYCAESVLLPEYRGQGAGHAFFDHREAQGRRLGRRYATFCAVRRPLDHPKRPADYAPLDPFWQKRGYRPLEGVEARFAWKDIGDAEATEKPMQFWIREL